MPKFSIKCIRNTALVLCLVVSPLSGCKPTVVVGGDSPVTTERLAGSTLVDIHKSVSWSFKADFVLIENNGESIPPDVVDQLLPSGLTPERIEAKWQFNPTANAIELQDIMLDGKSIDSKLSIPIRPAGHVRVNLGPRQYNMSRSTIDASK